MFTRKLSTIPFALFMLGAPLVGCATDDVDIDDDDQEEAVEMEAQEISGAQANGTCAVVDQTVLPAGETLNVRATPQAHDDMRNNVAGQELPRKVTAGNKRAIVSLAGQAANGFYLVYYRPSNNPKALTGGAVGKAELGWVFGKYLKKVTNTAANKSCGALGIGGALRPSEAAVTNPFTLFAGDCIRVVAARNEDGGLALRPSIKDKLPKFSDPARAGGLAPQGYAFLKFAPSSLPEAEMLMTKEGERIWFHVATIDDKGTHKDAWVSGINDGGGNFTKAPAAACTRRNMP